MLVELPGRVWKVSFIALQSLELRGEDGGTTPEMISFNGFWD